jgi:hypothetical protein
LDAIKTQKSEAPQDVLLASKVSQASGFWISKKLTDKSNEKLKQIGHKSFFFKRTGELRIFILKRNGGSKIDHYKLPEG